MEIFGETTMKEPNQKPLNSLKSIVFALGMTVLLGACASVESKTPKTIKIDGSSTVYPITQAVAEKFKASYEKPVDMTVNFSGTTGGFRKFCEGETDISNASRPIHTDEMAMCNRYNVRYIELPIAFDALTVVVNKDNNWIESITIAELKKMWEPAAQGKIERWNQIRAGLPDKPLNLFGAGKDSGTFDYFSEAIVGKEDVSRTDYVASEDDDILVQGVSQDPNALGYFGLAYYEKRASEMKALAIDNGNGPVMPSRETVVKAEYQPLARPLFIYINAEKAQKNAVLRDFVEFYLNNAETIVEEVGYIPLTKEHYHLDRVTFYNGEVGTVFEGKSKFDLTLAELLRKKAKF
jgi:phosphate transport system substrate-binding protein